MSAPVKSLEDILERNLSGEDLSEAKRILYGKQLPSIDIPQAAQQIGVI